MDNKIFTIIIPHKNIPNLLQRCLDSIPFREDIQIIVVDDNSDPKIVDFSRFPGMDRKNVEIIFSKEGKGAGYARNLGLQKAIGKWLLFSDSDDFFITEKLNLLLDKYADSNYDIIYFNTDSVCSDTLLPAKRNIAIERYFKQKEIEAFKYKLFVPWCKLVRRSIQTDNNIFFSETKAANDAMFSVKCAYYSKKIDLIDLKAYCVTHRSGSLEMTPSISNLEDRIKVSLEVNSFFKEHGIKSKCNLYYYHLSSVLLRDFSAFMKNVGVCHSYGYSYAYIMIKVCEGLLIKALKIPAKIGDRLKR